jgi:asparagine synthase (glutamine-hydrolysing)
LALLLGLRGKMKGVYGIIGTGAGPFADERESAASPAAIRCDESALWVHGWAHCVRQADGICVAGAAHLVEDGPRRAGGSGAEALETVAALYREHGVDAFRHLHGQFCLAVYDQPAHRLILATDRFATRSLYYSERSDGVVFGSSLDQVAPAQSRSIDAQAMLEYLLYAAIPAPRTPFEGVHKLPAGHLLAVDCRGSRVTPYWNMSYAESRNGGAASWARQLRAELEAAVNRYARAEPSLERVGAFLSGGTDSSTVAGMLGAAGCRPVKTFSIGYREDGYDELFYARAASRWFGTQQHEWKLSPAEALDALPAIVAYYEEPFGNASALPTYRCAQLAREHGVTVLFAGDGGDELFAGNSRYGSDKVFALYHRIPSVLRGTLLDPVLSSLPDGLPVIGRARRYVRRANIPNPRRILSYSPLLSDPLSDLVGTEFLAAVQPDALLDIAEAHYHQPAAGTSELNRLMYLDLHLAIADNDVRKVSGMTELAGVEVRYPFLDSHLAEFSGRIPSALKLRGFRKRYIFKRALADFLPPEVLTKRKHGFGAPVAVWMRSDTRWREFVGDLLHDPCARQRGYLKPSVLDRFWKQLAGDGASFYGDSLWPWLMLELWHRRQDVAAVAQRGGARPQPEGVTV